MTNYNVDELVSRIEYICKNRKNVKCDDFPKLCEQTLRMYPQFRKPFDSCLGNIKNIIEECLKLIHMDIDIKSKVSLEWFKSFLGTVMESIKVGIYIAKRLIGFVIKSVTRTFPEFVLALIVTSILAGTVASIILIGIGLWMGIVHKRLKSLIDYLKDFVKTTKGEFTPEPNEDEEIPEELLPPKVQVPKITISMVNLDESTSNITESMEMIGAVLFIIFLKAAIAKSFTEELNRKMDILKYLFTPTAALTAFLTMLVYFASNGIASI